MQSRRHMPLVMLAVSTLFAPAATAGDTKVELEAATGYDSNPYRVSANEQGGSYVDLDAGVDYENPLSDATLFFLSLDADSTVFFGDADDASHHSAGMEAGMEFEWGRRGNDRFKLKLGAESDMRRGTYVSRFTGQIGEIGGTPIPDRFDYNRVGAFVESDYYLGRDAQFALDVKFYDKNYVEDYSALGADRLDATQWAVAPKFEYEITDKWQTSLFVEFAKRTYDDRPVDDASGTPIPGRNREYDYQDYGFDVEYAPTETLEWSFGYSAGNRRDNGGGYWDYDSADYFVQLESKFASDAELSIKLYRTEKEYDNVVVVANPEEQYARTGNGIELDYERNVTIGQIRDMTLFAKLDYFDGSESSSRSAYTRGIAMVGVGKRF